RRNGDQRAARRRTGVTSTATVVGAASGGVMVIVACPGFSPRTITVVAPFGGMTASSVTVATIRSLDDRAIVSDSSRGDDSERFSGARPPAGSRNLAGSEMTAMGVAESSTMVTVARERARGNGAY